MPVASVRPPRCTSPRPASARSASSTWTRSTPSNLQRQILHNLDRIGDRKVDSAKKTLTLLNPDVDVVTYDTRLDASNIIDIMTGYDVIVDGADNFPSRYLLNDASVKLGIPVVHGSIFRFEGMVSVFHPLQGPTYRDMVPEPPPAELAPSCAEAGVLGVLPGIVGTIQALEAIKMLLGLGDPLIGRILAIDTTDMSFRTFKLARIRPTRSPTRTATGSSSTSSRACALRACTTDAASCFRVRTLVAVGRDSERRRDEPVVARSGGRHRPRVGVGCRSR